VANGDARAASRRTTVTVSFCFVSAMMTYLTRHFFRIAEEFAVDEASVNDDDEANDGE
jgi:hypothetical protein